jgi:hypothetical protein
VVQDYALALQAQGFFMLAVEVVEAVLPHHHLALAV